MIPFRILLNLLHSWEQLGNGWVSLIGVHRCLSGSSSNDLDLSVSLHVLSLNSSWTFTSAETATKLAVDTMVVIAKVRAMHSCLIRPAVEGSNPVVLRAPTGL